VRTGWTDADLEQIESAANQIESPETRRWAHGALMASDARPFVLLDDARPGGQAWLYAEPAEIIETRDPAEVRALPRAASRATRRRLPRL
jgi:hypothetical protein